MDKETLEYEEQTAKIGWDGKQHIIRVPGIISELTKLDKKKPRSVRFKFNYKTRELEMKLLESDKK